MEGIGVLLFIVMIVISLVEQANKAKRQGKPGQRPPGRWPGAELPPGRPGRPGRPGAPAGGRPESGPVLLPDADARSASEMVAEDFWRELTGQPPRPRPTPPAQPAPVEASSWDEAAVRQVEAPPPEVASRRESASASWEYRRPETVHEPPVIVSLEEPLADPDVRHAGYHRRLATQAAPAVVSAGPRASPLVRRLRRGEGLRESVIMAEVFGRPRGLEEHSPDR